MSGRQDQDASSRAPIWLFVLNAALAVALPVAWVAPLLRARLLPWFGGQEISVLSGIMVLWEDAPILAVLVVLFAMAAPLLKVVLTALSHLGQLSRAGGAVLGVVSKLAMADVFLVALYIVAAKGVGVGRVEPAWGLWLFTGVVLMGLALSLVEHLRLLP